MQKEQSILKELVQQGKLTYRDASEMIQAIDKVERKSVWEEDGDFDPRNFVAKIGNTSSQTMLNDILWMIRSNITEDIIPTLRVLKGEEKEKMLSSIRELKGKDPDQFRDKTLLDNIDYLRRQAGLDGIATLVAFKELEEFAGCVALESVDIDKGKKIMMNSTKQKGASEEFRLSFPMKAGDVINLTGPTSVEICQSDSENCEIIGVKECWADTKDEARKLVKDLKIWDFSEGNRVWIYDSRMQEMLGFLYMVHLKIFVPKDVKISGWVLSKVKVKDLYVDISLQISRLFQAENVTGHLFIDSDTKDMEISGLNGSAEIEAKCGNILVRDSKADLELRSVLGDITCQNLAGACKAKLINGSLSLKDTCTSNLELSTKNGTIDFSGVVMPSSSYTIKSNSGDINVALEKRSECGLKAETGEGEININIHLDNENDGYSVSGSYETNLRRGTGNMDITSKSGNINISMTP